MSTNMVLWLVIASGVVAALYSWLQSGAINKLSPGNEKMQEIAAAIQEGAKAYLNRQYTTIGWVGVAVTIVLAIAFRNWQAPVGFVLGAVLSGAAGFIGMNVSVRANVRTAEASRKSLAAGLDVAFKSGAVTGMLVAGFALLGVAGYYMLLTQALHYNPTDRIVVDSLVTLGFGASLISIFAVSAAASSPRAPTLAATWSARSKPAFRKMIRATPRRSLTRSATMSATALVWRPICSKPMRCRR